MVGRTLSMTKKHKEEGHSCYKREDHQAQESLRFEYHIDLAMVQEERVSTFEHNCMEGPPTRRTSLENETVQEEGNEEVRKRTAQ